MLNIYFAGWDDFSDIESLMIFLIVIGIPLGTLYLAGWCWSKFHPSAFRSSKPAPPAYKSVAFWAMAIPVVVIVFCALILIVPALFKG